MRAQGPGSCGTQARSGRQLVGKGPGTQQLPSSRSGSQPYSSDCTICPFCQMKLRRKPPAWDRRAGPCWVRTGPAGGSRIKHPHLPLTSTSDHRGALKFQGSVCREERGRERERERERERKKNTPSLSSRFIILLQKLVGDYYSECISCSSSFAR